MSTKTISIDLEAYRRLQRAKRSNESFSQVIKRRVTPAFDFDAWLKKVEKIEMDAGFVEAVEARNIGTSSPKQSDSLMACLDTTVFLDLRGRGGKAWKKPAEEVLRRLLAGGDTLVTTRMNIAELYVGIEGCTDPAKEKQQVDEALAGMEILEFDDAAARAFARIQVALRRSGKSAGDMDVLIAAIALVNGQPVVTRNRKHFVDMPGVTIIDYGNG